MNHSIVILFIFCDSCNSVTYLILFLILAMASIKLQLKVALAVAELLTCRFMDL